MKDFEHLTIKAISTILTRQLNNDLQLATNVSKDSVALFSKGDSFTLESTCKATCVLSHQGQCEHHRSKGSLLSPWNDHSGRFWCVVLLSEWVQGISSAVLA